MRVVWKVNGDCRNPSSLERPTIEEGKDSPQTSFSTRSSHLRDWSRFSQWPQVGQDKIRINSSWHIHSNALDFDISRRRTFTHYYSFHFYLFLIFFLQTKKRRWVVDFFLNQLHIICISMGLTQIGCWSNQILQFLRFWFLHRNCFLFRVFRDKLCFDLTPVPENFPNQFNLAQIKLLFCLVCL